MQRRTFVSHLVFAGAAAGFTGIPNALAQVAAKEEDVANWSSDTVREAFGRFAATHRMPEALNRWLTDPAIQCIKPYKVFDNVWNVGLKWVSAYLIDTGEGWVLIDTTHEPFVDHLIENIAAVGVALDDIRYVLMTHGHFDHVGRLLRAQASAAKRPLCHERARLDRGLRGCKGFAGNPAGLEK